MYEICFTRCSCTLQPYLFSLADHFPDARKVFQIVRHYKPYLLADSVIWEPIQLFRWPASVVLFVLRGRQTIRSFEISRKVRFITGTHSAPDLFDAQEGSLH